MSVRKKITAAALTAAVAAAAVFSPSGASAASEDIYLSLGADLSPEEQDAVLALLDVPEEDFDENTVIYIGTGEVRKYLGAGDGADDGAVEDGTDEDAGRSVVSCKVTQRKKGSGIHVETHHITDCTPDMYESALATAGMENADVVIAAPEDVSGTGALVGAMEAYAKLNGQVIDAEAMKGAAEELLTSISVSENTGSADKTSLLIAAVKEIIAADSVSDEKTLGEAVDDVAGQLGITLTGSDREMLISLLKKISGLDPEEENLTEQAGSLYEEMVKNGLDLSRYGIEDTDLISSFRGLPGFMKTFIRWLREMKD